MGKSIPKKIHYCWFGNGEKSELIKKCIASWEKYMPDYEIVEWNEKNFAIDNIYAKEAYELKMYAFVSDYARLKIIYEEGGIYLDTDVELIKSLEPLLKEGGILAFERKSTIATGLGFAAEAGNKIVKCMLSAYDSIHFVNNGIQDKTPCPVRNTDCLVKLGLKTDNTKQVIGNVWIYPQEYFCPIDYDSGKLRITENTYSIHHYGYSWADEKAKKILKIKRTIFKLFPRFCAQKIFDIVNHIYR